MSDYTNLQKISQENAFSLAKFFINSGKNLLLFGRRGTGKTEIILQAIKECKYKVNYINLSVMERCDLGGYPNIHSNDDIITFKSPHYLPKLEDGHKPNIVLLFDEIDKCSPETTAPLLEILQFHKINGVPLNIVACMLTSNLINENAHSNLISSALLDRVAKYTLDFDFHQWIDWAKANNVHDLILGFLRSHPEFACGKLEDSCYASPSPRAWALASDALIKARNFKIVDIDTITKIISGYVGGEAGIKFKVWYSYFREYEPYIKVLIEKGQMSIDFSTLSPSQKIVFVITACHHAKIKTLENKSKNKFLFLENLCKFINDYNVDPEIKMIALNNAFSFDMITKHKLYTCNSFFTLFNSINEKIYVK